MEGNCRLLLGAMIGMARVSIQWPTDHIRSFIHSFRWCRLFHPLLFIRRQACRGSWSSLKHAIFFISKRIPLWPILTDSECLYWRERIALEMGNAKNQRTKILGCKKGIRNWVKKIKIKLNQIYSNKMAVNQWHGFENWRVNWVWKCRERFIFQE